MKIPSVPAAPFEKTSLVTKVNLRASTGLPEEIFRLTLGYGAKIGLLWTRPARPARQNQSH